jgi:gliding motility-associated-like protein
VITGTPVIGVAKSLSSTVLQNDGTYDLTFTITVKNMGSLSLSDIQVNDDLSKTFPAPLTFKVVGTILASGAGLMANQLFNGNTNKNLLVYGSTLAVGNTGTVTFKVNVNIHGSPGKFNNSATGTGLVQGTTVSDISTSGLNPDPDNNGKPDENDPTLIPLDGNAVIGISKAVSIPLRQLDGKNSNILTYSITVKNYGNVPLTDVQVSDDLLKTFPFPTEFSLEGIPVSTNGVLKINTAFNGNGINNLLQANNTLQSGQVDTIKITLKVTPFNDMMGPFDNSAIANATEPTGKVIQDISTSGSDPDPDNNGKPDESNVTQIMLEKATIRVPEGFSPNGDGINDGLYIENLDNEKLSLEVYNRWGNMIYKNNEYHNEWNGICNQGIYSGKDIPDGTYYYIVSKRDNKEKYIRFITINR